MSSPSFSKQSALEESIATQQSQQGSFDTVQGSLTQLTLAATNVPLPSRPRSLDYGDLILATRQVKHPSELTDLNQVHPLRANMRDMTADADQRLEFDLNGHPSINDSPGTNTPSILIRKHWQQRSIYI